MKINSEENAIAGGRYHNHKDFMNFPEIGKKKHYYTKLTPIRHKDLLPNTSILQVLRKKDVMLHYPYQTFNHFIDLFREAAIDPQGKRNRDNNLSCCRRIKSCKCFVECHSKRKNCNRGYRIASPF